VLKSTETRSGSKKPPHYRSCAAPTVSEVIIANWLMPVEPQASLPVGVKPGEVAGFHRGKSLIAIPPIRGAQAMLPVRTKQRNPQ